MQVLIGFAAVGLVLVLVVGVVSGRVKVRSCCAPGDPSLDRRMQVPESRNGLLDPTSAPGQRVARNGGAPEGSPV